MKNVHNLDRYKEAVQNIGEVMDFIQKLDKIQKMLENSLGMEGCIEIFHKIEEIKIDYIIRHIEYERIIYNKGK